MISAAVRPPLPAPMAAGIRLTSAMTLILDDLLPRYQFSEHHRIDVRAAPAVVFAAVEGVDLTDSALARGLMWIWRRGARLVLDQVEERPMSVRDFIQLACEAPRELVRGMVAGAPRGAWTPARFKAHDAAGFKLAWSFWVTDLGAGRCRVDTETRVLCTDAATRRWFFFYWLLIRLPSGLIRRDLLRIIKARAENTMSAGEG